MLILPVVDLVETWNEVHIEIDPNHYIYQRQYIQKNYRKPKKKKLTPWANLQCFPTCS
jgi:hypothetical protein